MPPSHWSPRSNWHGVERRRSACSRAAWRRPSSRAKRCSSKIRRRRSASLCWALVSEGRETPPPRSSISIGRWRSGRIAMRRLRRRFSIRTFFPTRISRHNRRRDDTGGMRSAPNSQGAGLRHGRSIRRSASSSDMCLPTSGLIRRHLLSCRCCDPTTRRTSRSTATRPRRSRDPLTAVFQSLADVWVDALSLSDDELADRIQADGVDILVDLSGYTTGNRLNVFARKPAPVQVTAWGSGTGTGLQTMDYFFADPVTIPQDVRHLFAERVYDLPSVITMEPISDVQPSALPMLRNGFVTFGVFNRIDKISDEVLAIWSKLLRAVTGSKIVVKHLALDEAFLRDGLVGRFVAQGVPQDRVICIGSTARRDHLQGLREHRYLARSVSAERRHQHLGIALHGRSGHCQARQWRVVACRRSHPDGDRSRRLGRRR